MKEFWGRNKRVLIILFFIIYYIYGMLHVVSVTSLYEPMGDDKMNLLGINLVEESDLFNLMARDITSTFGRLCDVHGRYFPIPTTPLFVLKYISGSIFKYRLYLAVFTFVDIVLLASLVYRFRSKAWVYMAIIGPIMLNVFGYNDGNALYSYHALVQKVFMMMLLVLHFELSWIRTKKTYFFVGSFIITIIGCFQYEIGYLVIFPAFIVAWFGQLEQNSCGIQNVISKYIHNISCVLIPLCCAFAVYLAANFNAGGDTAPDTTIRLSFARILLATIMELGAASPIRIPLYSYGLLTRDDIIMQDCIFPAMVAITFLVIFITLEYQEIELRAYIRGLLFALSVIIPTAVLISMTVKFQPWESSWVNWNSGWIVSTVCSFGYMIIIGYLLLGLRQIIDLAYKEHENFRVIARVLCGLLLSFMILAVGVYGHATARIHGNNRAYMYNFACDSLQSGLLSSCEDGAIVVSNYNVWGGDDEAEKAFLKVYSNSEYEAYYVDSYWDHGFNSTEQKNKCYVYNFVYGSADLDNIMDKQAQLAMVAFAIDDKLTMADGMRLYIDLSSFEGNENIKYYVQDGENKSEKTICYSDLKEISNGKDRFFYEIRDDNILIQEISIVE